MDENVKERRSPCSVICKPLSLYKWGIPHGLRRSHRGPEAGANSKFTNSKGHRVPCCWKGLVKRMFLVFIRNLYDASIQNGGVPWCGWPKPPVREVKIPIRYIGYGVPIGDNIDDRVLPEVGYPDWKLIALKGTCIL